MVSLAAALSTFGIRLSLPDEVRGRHTQRQSAKIETNAITAVGQERLHRLHRRAYGYLTSARSVAAIARSMWLIRMIPQSLGEIVVFVLVDIDTRPVQVLESLMIDADALGRSIHGGVALMFLPTSRQAYLISPTALSISKTAVS